MLISEADHDKIAQAVAAAEARTSGEIRCVLASETGSPALTGVAAAPRSL